MHPQPCPEKHVNVSDNYIKLCNNFGFYLLLNRSILNDVRTRDKKIRRARVKEAGDECMRLERQVALKRLNNVHHDDSTC